MNSCLLASIIVAPPHVANQPERRLNSVPARPTETTRIPVLQAIAHLAHTHHFATGVVISASHNPWQDNGIKIFGGTLTPFENETFLPGAWNPAREAVRQAVNAWMREANAFDSVIDFDAGLRDPERPTSMLPHYDCGDHLHPSDAGYHRMGDIINLSLFD